MSIQIEEYPLYGFGEWGQVPSSSFVKSGIFTSKETEKTVEESEAGKEITRAGGVAEQKALQEQYYEEQKERDEIVDSLKAGKKKETTRRIQEKAGLISPKKVKTIVCPEGHEPVFAAGQWVCRLKVKAPESLRGECPKGQNVVYMASGKWKCVPAIEEEKPSTSVTEPFVPTFIPQNPLNVLTALPSASTPQTASEPVQAPYSNGFVLPAPIITPATEKTLVEKMGVGGMIVVGSGIAFVLWYLLKGR